MTNPILKEIHDIRRQILAEHKDDLGEYLRSEFARAKAEGHPVAKIKQRTIGCTGDRDGMSMGDGRSSSRSP